MFKVTTKVSKTKKNKVKRKKTTATQKQSHITHKDIGTTSIDTVQVSLLLLLISSFPLRFAGFEQGFILEVIHKVSVYARQFLTLLI